jgi:phage-related protein
MLALGDMAASMGLSLEELATAVQSATTGEFEPLKRLGIVARVEGNKVAFTFRGQKTKIKRDAAEIQKFLVSLGETAFAGGMERQMDTIGGRLSNLKDATFNLFVAIGEAGLNDAIIELTTLFIDASASTKGLAQILGRVLGKAVRTMTKLLAFLGRHAKAVGIVLGSLGTIMLAFKVATFLQSLKAMAIAFKAVGSAALSSTLNVAVFLAPIIIIILVLQDLIVFLQGGDSMIGRFLARFEGAGGIMGTFADGLRQIINAIIMMIATLVPVFEDLQAQLQPIIEDLAGTILELVGSIVDVVVEVIMAVVPLVVEIIVLIVEVIAAILPAVVEIVGLIVMIIAEVLPPIIEVIVEVIKLVVEVIKVIIPIIVGIIKIVIAIIKVVVKIIVAIIKVVVRVVVPIVRAIVKGIRWLVNLLRDELEPFADDLTQWVKDIAADIGRFWDKVEPAIKSFGKLASNILDGIVMLVDDIIGGIKEFLGIADEEEEKRKAADRRRQAAKVGQIEAATAAEREERAIEFAKVTVPGAFGFAAPAGGRIAAGAAGQITSDITVQSLNVNIAGQTNMGAGQLERATSKGTFSAMKRVNRETVRAFSDGALP